MEVLYFHQTMTTHIMEHIHEWHIWQRLCKFKLDDSILLDYFLESLLPIIVKYVASTMPHIEEESISKSQQLYPIYG
jgi:hypothetical protein